MERNLWDKSHNHIGLRKEELGKEQIRELLKTNTLQFAVGNLYDYIRWIPFDQTYDYWKAEVMPHLMEPGKPYYRDELPHGYGYFASRGQLEREEVVFLEMCH